MNGKGRLCELQWAENAVLTVVIACAVWAVGLFDHNLLLTRNTQESVHILMEFMNRGSLRDALEKSGDD